MQPEAPLTLILSPLRAGRGEIERKCLGSLFGDPDTVPPKVPSPFVKGRGSGWVRLDCIITALWLRWRVAMEALRRLAPAGSPAVRYRALESWCSPARGPARPTQNRLHRS